MKFKMIYLYGLIAVVSIILLIFVSQQSSTPNGKITADNNSNMPEDDVHKKLREQASGPPNKDNVSEAYREKLEGLKSAVDKNPNDTLAIKNYADFLSAAHKMNEAIQYYNKILEIDSRRADIHFALSVIYYTRQDFVNSEKENNEVLAFDPNNQMALYNLGAIAATKGNISKAKDLWNKVLKINPESETGKLATESLGKLN
ncbi:MAG: tetratricopeptide repeat protein [Ignavibacteria bacterium]|nr:tetratricopeptide repeat protein [Ignavibacteria bacterium]